MPPKPSAREPLLVPDRDLEAGRLGELDGLVGEPGRVLDVGRHGGEQPRAPAGTAERDGAGERVVGARVGQAREHDPRDGRVLGRVGAPVERERAEHRAGHEGARGPRPGRSRGSRWRRRRGRVVARASAAPARRKSVDARRSPTPTSSTQAPASSRPRRAAPGTRRPRRRARSRAAASSAPSRSTPSASPSSAAPGPSSVAVARPGSTGKRAAPRRRGWRAAARRSSANSGGETWAGARSRVGNTVSRRRP